MTTAPPDHLSKLPSDLLVDSLLPAIAPRDLVALSLANRAWHHFVAGEGGPCEILWQRRAASDFRFPVLASGRRTGWRALYSSLASSSASQTTNGRLGFPSHRTGIPPSLRSLVIGDALPVPTLIELPAPPVALVAGGWSFHALGSNGEVVSWGQLNGGLFAGDDAPLSNEGRTVRPMVLPQSEAVGPVAQLEAGRAHVVMRGEDGRAWEVRALGRVVEVRDEGGRWGASAGGGQGAIVLVQAGWDYSAVLTAGGDIYVWWGLAPAASDEGAAAAGEDDLDDPSSQGVAFPLDLDTLRLPPLPSSSSSTLAADPISLISCGDDLILALTRTGTLYRLDLSPVAPNPNQPRIPPGAFNDPHDSPIRSRESRSRLEAAFVSGARRWTCLRRFCDISEVGRLEGLSVSGETRITHVSAHFESFAAYSVPSSSDPTGSIVLLGRKDMDDSAAPVVIPQLQNIGVIKIAHGDYHNLALTSSGHLFAWGAWSAGALGLGHPQLANTPLSSPTAAPPPRDSQQQPRPYPMPQFGDAPQQPHPLFPGFLPARPAAPVQRPPERVDMPTRVRFHGELRGGTETGRAKYVYAVAASGWHSGCLAVEASSSSPSSTSTTATRPDADDDDDEQEEPMIRLQRRATAEQEMADLARAADEERLNGSRGWMGRLGTMGPFRVGFAGRGARGGGAGGLTRGGGRV
ncbi:uncharacterized protein RHOBADRAFT_53234 [Rhodotorula graminis WP1]|uniref:F-box domain-containing protein n=1 Tax=Rhodotorula graminis (strain WP1) TaxID=578459 RepID=A0A194S3Z3_RHOGW|nr:uncharacterized protein RHOBADRAFT_53234 [Rhodotorula graminis WP1]KPV75230.1 hypothetical protein RHOBADRAFT_53234 [Rhodotorula graminis WP1]